MNDTKLPMRRGVGIILLNNENQVFVGKRKDNPGDKWQMPQGGVEDGEDFVTAMRRELYEETNIKNIKILKEIKQMYNSLFMAATKSSPSSTPPCGICHLSPGLSFLFPTKT